MNDEQVREALRALADHDRAEQAPTFVEARVLAAFRAKRKRPAWPWALGLVAAAILAVALWPRAEQPETQQATTPLRIEPQLVPGLVDAAPPPPPPPPPPPGRRPRPPAVAAASPSAEPREVVTEFFPLMDVMPPIEYGQVVRVSVPASTMRVMGVPVRREMWNQRVEAEVLVGEEGLARAIRFVGYEQ